MPARRQDLEEWEAFIRADAHILRRAPRCLFQSAANQPDDTSPARAADRLQRNGEWQRPWLRWLNKPRAAGPCLVTLSGHRSAIYHCTYSPDGTRIASCSGDGTARLWDAVDGRELASLSGFEHATGQCVFSPDSRLLVVTDSHGLIRCCDASSGVPTRDPSPHYGGIRLCRFTSNGRRMITVGARTIKVRDRWGGVERTLSSDGREIAITCGDVVERNYLTLVASDVDPEAGVKLADLRGYITDCDVACDGRLAGLVFSNGDLFVVDLNDGSRTLGASGRYTVCGFAPDSSLLAAWQGDEALTLSAWTPGGTPRWRLDGILRWTFSPDGSRFITADERPLWGNRFLRDTQTGQIILAFEDSARSQGRICAVSSDGARVVAVDYSGQAARLWDAYSGRRIAVLEGHRAPIDHCAFSPDGRLVVTASSDGTLLVFGSADGRRRTRLAGHTNRIGTFAFSPDSSRIVSASDDGDLRVWTIGDEGDAAFEFGALAAQYDFSPDGTLLASADWNGRVKLWNAESGALIAQLYDPGEDVVWMNDLRVSPTGGCVACAGTTGGAEWERVPKLRLWSVARSREIVIPDPPHTAQTVCAFSPDGAWLVTGGVDGLRTYDVRTGLQLSDVRAGQTPDGVPIGRVTACAVSPDSRCLLVGFADGAVGIWDIAGNGVLTFDRFLDWELDELHDPFSSEILVCAWLPEGDRVLCSSHQHVAIVRLSTGETRRFQRGGRARPDTPEAPGYVVLPDGRCLWFRGELPNDGIRGNDRDFDEAGRIIHTPMEGLTWLSPDGRSGIVVEGTHLAVWDMAKRVAVCELYARFDCGAPRWSPDGRRIVARDCPGTLQLLELVLPSDVSADGA